MSGKVAKYKPYTILGRAAKILNQHRVIYVDVLEPGVIRGVVRGTNDRIYIVTINIRDAKASCTCPYYIFKGITCKHIIAVLLKYQSIVRRNLLHRFIRESRGHHFH